MWKFLNSTFTRLVVILKFPYLCTFMSLWCFDYKGQAGEAQCFDCKKKWNNISSWEDKHFFSFILDKVLVVNNKRNQLKINGIKIYSSKQSMTSSGSIKTKIYKWRLALAALWYKIEDHQDLSSSWKWRIFTFFSTKNCKSLQIKFSQTHTCNLCRNW